MNAEKLSGLSSALNDIEAVAYSFSILWHPNECRLKSFVKLGIWWENIKNVARDSSDLHLQTSGGLMDRKRQNNPLQAHQDVFFAALLYGIRLCKIDTSSGISLKI